MPYRLGRLSGQNGVRSNDKLYRQQLALLKGANLLRKTRKKRPLIYCV